VPSNKRHDTVWQVHQRESREKSKGERIVFSSLIGSAIYSLTFANVHVYMYIHTILRYNTVQHRMFHHASIISPTHSNKWWLPAESASFSLDSFCGASLHPCCSPMLNKEWNDHCIVLVSRLLEGTHRYLS